jgi:dsDNA-binding SOS-regulon protein
MTDLSDTTNRFILEVIEHLDDVQHEADALWLATKALRVSDILDDLNALSNEVARLTDRLRKTREGSDAERAPKRAAA